MAFSSQGYRTRHPHPLAPRPLPRVTSHTAFRDFGGPQGMFGISFTLKHHNQPGALVLIHADGSMRVNHGGTEMGQGLHTKILGIAMRELGLPISRIRPMHTRTDKVPDASATAASSGTDFNGMTVADACRELRERLIPLATEILQRAETDARFSDGQVRGSAGSSIPFATLTSIAYTRLTMSKRTGPISWPWSSAPANTRRPWFSRYHPQAWRRKCHQTHPSRDPWRELTSPPEKGLSPIPPAFSIHAKWKNTSRLSSKTAPAPSSAGPGNPHSPISRPLISER